MVTSGYVPNIHHPDVMRSILEQIVDTGDVIGAAGPGQHYPGRHRRQLADRRAGGTRCRRRRPRAGGCPMTPPVGLSHETQEPYIAEQHEELPIVACSRRETAARVLLASRRPHTGRPRTAGSPAPARP